MIQKSISTSVVVILDCCYSGSAKVSRGNGVFIVDVDLFEDVIAVYSI
ncbi:MAG: hypothetical protein WAZ77_04855 [Candidatus Nitrosopolaris sp.]|jgi:hypothetical protein